jgi:hypothetical protein
MVNGEKLSAYAIERLSLFSTLSDGWYHDDDGPKVGNPVTDTTMHNVILLLEELVDLPEEPSLVASYEGGIGIIWKHKETVLVDLVIVNSLCNVWHPLHQGDGDDDDYDIYYVHRDFDKLCAFVRHHVLGSNNE